MIAEKVEQNVASQTSKAAAQAPKESINPAAAETLKSGASSGPYFAFPVSILFLVLPLSLQRIPCLNIKREVLYCKDHPYLFLGKGYLLDISSGRWYPRSLSEFTL